MSKKNPIVINWAGRAKRAGLSFLTVNLGVPWTLWLKSPVLLRNCRKRVLFFLFRRELPHFHHRPTGDPLYNCRQASDSQHFTSWVSPEQEPRLRHVYPWAIGMVTGRSVSRTIRDWLVGRWRRRIQDHWRATDTKSTNAIFLVEFRKIGLCFHEHACEIFRHSELKWPCYALPNVGNRASSDFGVFLPTDCCDVMSEHAMKRACVFCIARTRSRLLWLSFC